jgi:hypothetical protein
VPIFAILPSAPCSYRVYCGNGGWGTQDGKAERRTRLRPTGYAVASAKARRAAAASWTAAVMAGLRCLGEVRREALEKALKPLRAGAWGEDGNFRRGRRRRKFLPHIELWRFLAAEIDFAKQKI